MFGWREERERHVAASGRTGNALGLDSRELTGAWFAEAHRELGRGYHEWFDPVVGKLVGGLLAGVDVDEEAVRLGIARAHLGFTLEEAEADLALLLSLLRDAARGEVSDEDLSAAVASGFESVGPESSAPTDQFGGPSDLRRGLLRTYREQRIAGLPPADNLALLLVDVDVGELTTAEQGRTLHAVGSALRDHFPFVDEIAGLGPRRFAVLAHRHPGLAVAVAALRRHLRTDPGLLGAGTALWLAPLPVVASGLGAFVRRLVANPVPEWAVGDEDGGGIPELMTHTPRPTAPVREADWTEEVRRRASAAWHGGLSLAAAAVAVLVLATGVVRAVGPSTPRPGPASTASGSGAAMPDGERSHAEEVAVEAGPGTVTGATVPDPDPEAGASTRPGVGRNGPRGAADVAAGGESSSPPAPAPAAPPSLPSPPTTTPAPAPTPSSGEPDAAGSEGEPRPGQRRGIDDGKAAPPGAGPGTHELPPGHARA